MDGEENGGDTPLPGELVAPFGTDLGDLRDILGDAYEKVDELSDISWGSDAGDDAKTVAPDPVATRMLRAESEDEKAVQDVMHEVEQLRALLGDSKQQLDATVRRVPGASGSHGCTEGLSGLNEVDRLLEEDAKQGAEVSFNPSVNQREPSAGQKALSSGAQPIDSDPLVPPSKRIRREVVQDGGAVGDLAVASSPTIENLKWEDPVGGGKYGSIIGSQSGCSLQGLDVNDLQSDAKLSVKSMGRSSSQSKIKDGGNRSIMSVDFEGLLSGSHGKSGAKSMEECNQSICTADFEGLMSDRGGGRSKSGKSTIDDGNQSIRTADFEGLMSDRGGWHSKSGKSTVDDGIQSIRTADFEGLMSDRGGWRSKSGKSTVDDGIQSIRTADFEGLMSDRGGWRSKSGKSTVDDGNQSIQTADFEGVTSERGWGWRTGTKTGTDAGGSLGCDVQHPYEREDPHGKGSIESDDKVGLDDVLNGILPKNLCRGNIVMVLENVLERNRELQLELEATMASIDAAIEHNSKAMQGARALLTMRNDNGKLARPRSSCVLDEGRPVVVNHTIQTSYWSSADGKHPELNKDAKKMQTLMNFLPSRHRNQTTWTLREEELLSAGLTSYVQELCREGALKALEKRQKTGSNVSLGTARNIISELGSLDIKSPVALAIISKFTKAQWKHIAQGFQCVAVFSPKSNNRMYVGTRSGFECLLQWNCFTRPDRIKSKFTKREMLKIKLMANELGGKNWVRVAKELGTGRSAAECFRAHIQLLALPGKTWNLHEDGKLAKLIEHYGMEHWELIGHEMGRSGKCCENRFKNVLTVKNGRVVLKTAHAWDLQDDLDLFKAIRMCGKRWHEVAHLMGNRKTFAIRDRYNNLDPTVDVSPFTNEEKQQILEIGREEYKKYGRIRWVELQRRLPVKRNLRVLRSLYINMLRAVEREENAFACTPTLKPPRIEPRLEINIDGSKAEWSNTEQQNEPLQTVQQPSEVALNVPPLVDLTCEGEQRVFVQEVFDPKIPVEGKEGFRRKGSPASEGPKLQTRARRKSGSKRSRTG